LYPSGIQKKLSIYFAENITKYNYRGKLELTLVWRIPKR